MNGEIIPDFSNNLHYEKASTAAEAGGEVGSVFRHEEDLPEDHLALWQLAERLSLNSDQPVALLSSAGIEVRRTPEGEIRWRDGVHPSLIARLEEVMHSHKTQEDISQQEGAI